MALHYDATRYHAALILDLLYKGEAVCGSSPSRLWESTERSCYQVL